MGLLRKLQDARTYANGYGDGHNDGYGAGFSEGWDTGKLPDGLSDEPDDFKEI